MSKLAAFLAVLLVAAHVASAYRTVVTTVETESETENPSRQCQEQIMGADLSHCMDYLQERQGSYGPSERYSRGGRHFERCCDGLKRIRNEQCRCEGLQTEMQSTRRPEMRSMMREAQNLPNMCGVGPSMCRFDAPWL